MSWTYQPLTPSAAALLATAVTPIAGADTPAIAVSEDTTSRALLTREDALANGLTESSSVSTNRPALLAILTQWMGHAIPGRRYGAFTGRGVTIPTEITGSESIVLGLSDGLLALTGQLSMNDILALTVVEDRSLLVTCLRNETIVLGLLESVQAVVAQTGSDSVTAGLSDASSVLATINTNDALASGLTESVSLAALIASGESIQVGLSESALVSFASNILTQLMGYLAPGQRYGSFAGKVESNTTIINTGESLGLSLEETRTILALLTRDESIPFTIGDLAAVATALSGTDVLANIIVESLEIHQYVDSESIQLALTENASLRTLLSGADSLGLSITELAQMAIALSTSDTVQAVIAELSSLAISVTAADGLVIGLTDTGTVLIRVDREEALAIGASETTTILVRIDREDAPAIIIVESSSVEDLTTGTTSINTADTLTIGMVDAYLSVLATISTNDILTQGWDESLVLLASLSREDTISIGVAEVSSVAIAINSGGDAVRIGLSDSSQSAIMIAGSDAVSAVLTDASRIFASIATEDALRAGIDEVLSRILASISATETVSVIVVDVGSVTVPMATSDAVVIRMTDSGSAVEIFLNQIGSVLVATVRRLTGVNSTRFLQRIVRYLGTLRTIKVL